MLLRIAPFVLLVALSLLGACTPTPKDFGGGSGGGGFATASVSTVQAAGTSVIGSISNGTVPPFATPEPPTAIPTIPSASLSVTELKYRILDQYPDFFFCDPDYYPVAHGDEGDLARQRFPELQADAAQFNAILAHNGLAGLTSFSDDQKLLIYRDYKKLAALHFALAGNAYQFQFLTGGQGQQGSSIQGTIDGSGKITIQKQAPAFATCPICLAVHTRIDTPSGAVLVE